MKFPGPLNLRGISGQIAALVVVSIIALHLIVTTIFWLHRPDAPDPMIDHGHGQFIAAIQILGTAAPADRPRLMTDLTRTFPRLDLRMLPPETDATAAEPDTRIFHILRHHLGAGYRIFPLRGEHAGSVGVVLPDGAKISARLLPGRPPRRFWGGPWMATLLFAAISLTLLGLWAARALTAPLSSFAKAAEDFSLKGTAAPLPERGPEEIRSVAKALNRMRDRITGLIDDRTRMLAAISHDLRTPITRLRLRSEFIEDETHRRHMLRDLDHANCLSGTRAIWSQWDGYLKQERGLALLAELEARGIPLKHAHTSGHASIPDLKRLADAIQPKMLVPIHTYEPEQFPAHFKAVSIKNDGEWWDVPT